jgi:hypothetical protein
MRKETLQCETNQLDDAPVTGRDEGDLPPPRERSLSTLCRWTPTAGTPRAQRQQVVLPRPRRQPVAEEFAYRASRPA